MINLLKQKKLKRTVLISIFSVAATITTGFAQQSVPWVAPDAAKLKKNPVAVDEASLAAGKKSFEKECLQCHGKKGKGDGPNAATCELPPGNLTLAKVQSQADGELFWKISEGKKPMPIGKKVFTEEQRWQLVNYIRTFAPKSK
ncbi:MAG: cytochrome c [Bacteroidetes bacterium]|nr:cytochrome c [Bacteroidota bacterium]